jgi:hypothetical protein
VPANIASPEARLLYLAGLNDRSHEKWGPIRSEVIQIMEHGGDIEATIGPFNRSPLGEAIKQGNIKTAELMLTEFAKRNSNRLPLAAKGSDVLDFLICKYLDKPVASVLIYRIPEIYTSGLEEFKASTSRAVSKFVLKNPEKAVLDDVRSSLIRAVGGGLVDDETMLSLWHNYPADEAHVHSVMPAFLAQQSTTGDEPTALVALAKFIAAGVDLTVPFTGQGTPIGYALKLGSIGFVSALLSSGADAGILLEQIKAEPCTLEDASDEKRALVYAFAARSRIGGVLRNTQQSCAG